MESRKGRCTFSRLEARQNAILLGLALSILLVGAVVHQGRGAGDLEEEETLRNTILKDGIPSGELGVDGEDEASGPGHTW